MKTYRDLEFQWNQCHGFGQILVDHTHPLKLYLNINANGNKELLIPITEFEARFKSTVSIGIKNYKNGKERYLAIELLDAKLQSEFISLCFDLIESSREANDESQARDLCFNALKKWYRLMAEMTNGCLPENEIRGLIGELLFITDSVNSGVDDISVIDAWKIQKDASRDFVFDDYWCEVKTVESTKDYVTISSIEQLDHVKEGNLVIYRLDRSLMGKQEAINLNMLVDGLKSIISFTAEVALNKKLLAKGYLKSEAYDHINFILQKKECYLVDDTFPRLKRANIPSEVKQVRYEMKICDLEKWAVNYGQ